LDATVRWNRFGTPQSLVRHGGYLATGIVANSPAAAARAWAASHRGLFRLGSLASLHLDRAVPLVGSDGHVVYFRQRFEGVESSSDGLLAVGVVGSRTSGWKVAYVSSSIAPDTALDGAAQIAPEIAWVRAAANVGHRFSVVEVKETASVGDWQTFSVEGLQKGAQKARLVAVPTPRDGAVPAYETLVAGPYASFAYKHLIDARTGRVLARQNLVDNAAEDQVEAEALITTPFSGEMAAVDAGCGPRHGPYTVTTSVRSISVAANATINNDIVLKLYRGSQLLRAADTGTTPESLTYAPTGGVPPGDYFVEVCDFRDGHAPDAPRTYTGTVTIDDSPPVPPYPPRWKVFPANPLHNTLPADPWNVPETDIRKTWCWDAKLNDVPVAGCEDEVKNLNARAPWDHDVTANVPTFTTTGNNANSFEAWVVTGGGIFTNFKPVNTARDYSFPWTNAWEVQDCPNVGTHTNGVPTLLVPGVSLDISAAVTNLFVMHNRMHDWAYGLGHTEETWNAQANNFGLTNPEGEKDPVIGRAQAGAIAPGSRDNANMATFPDGTSPVTNMFLWQPVSGSFYSPCVDGDYDMAVIGHEFTHMIENRMIGKGGVRNEHHAGAMGESHADLMAMEYLNENSLVPVTDENRYSEGSYVTGNKRRGIRNYGMNFPYSGDIPGPGTNPEIDPLNFSDMGYDLTGPQVHADGEIWSATNFEIRQALNAKYNASFPESDALLQRRCANAEIPVDLCPGNRRWAQLVFDSFLLMPIAPSMLDARDAQLAADVMRFGGANQSELWLAFARRGFGMNASSTNTNANTETDPTPDFQSPIHPYATVTFNVTTREGGNAPVSARIYVGHYEGGVSPVADTDPATSGSNLDEVAHFVEGVYEFVVNAPGYGHVRFRADLKANSSPTINIRMPTNYASTYQGAVATGDVNLQQVCTGSPPVCSSDTEAERADSLRSLIDDTEATHWERMEAVANVPPATTGPVVVDGTKVTVDLAGDSPQTINRVQVSAMLKPVERPRADGPQVINPNRFTALRQFEIHACNAATGADCSTDAGFNLVYASPANAFPSAPPRPVAPEMIIRSFDIPTTTATHLRLVVRASQCTGAPEFQGDQDAATQNPDCDAVATAGPGGTSKAGVRAAELQAFSTTPIVTGPTPPVVSPPPAGPPPGPPTKPPAPRRPAAARCVVPKTKGMTATRARKAIRSRRCRVGTIRTAFSSKVRKGRVISQSPRAGRRLRVGARVNLVVSKGARRVAARR
jgi:extracellular elastinolytic metalloproteinase